MWPPFSQGAGSAPRAANLAVGDLAVAEWHGRATSIADGPYDNDYCWVIRVAEDRIVGVRARTWTVRSWKSSSVPRSANKSTRP